MRSLCASLLLLFSSLSYSQVRTVKIGELEKRFHQNNDTTYIVNFWATWCSPCVRELPAFDSISRDFAAKPVKVLLVTLDFREDIDSKVLPFLSKHKLHPEVMLLDEVNGNYFIPRVSDKWSGAIPATLIVNNSSAYNNFYEKKLNYKILLQEILNAEAKH